ncbi:retrotransposon protein, putative, ty1-copia subclass [Tanacetum coccineum]
MTTTIVKNLVFRDFFEKQRLTGPNFMDWYRNLWIVLSVEDKLPYLEQPIPAMPIPHVRQVLPPDVLTSHSKWVKASKEIAGLMLMTMKPDIQKNLEQLGAYDTLGELKSLFAQQVEQELHQTVREFQACKQEEGQSVNSYVLKMKSYIDNLECLGHAMSQNLATITELHVMLKLHEKTLPKKDDAPALHTIREGKFQKKNKNKKPQLAAWGNNQRKRNSKLAYAPKSKIPLHQRRRILPRTQSVTSALRSDHGGEYMSQEFSDRLKEHEIIAHRTPPYKPQHNGVSERRNRTLLDMLCSMMSQTTLPNSFWDYAFDSAAHILNMVLTKKVEKTPYEVWHGQAPKLSCLKIRGCEALVKRDTITKPGNLDPRSIKCISVGYPKETMRYSFYYPPKNKVLVARNAEFFEDSLITQEASRSLEDLEIIQEEDTHPSENTSSHHDEDNQEIDERQSDIIPIRKSTRIRNAPNRMYLDIEPDEYELGDLNKPANYKAALLDPKSDKWLNAMNVEILLTVKPLVVNDIRAIRILISIATFYDYEIWQMDVKTAFLNGHLLEEVYMVQPEGFANPKFLNRVCKLKCSIYGLNQALRCFAIKDLGEAAYILGIKIYRDRSKWLISLYQSAYIEKTLKRFFIENSKRGSIPMQEKLKLSKSQGASTPTELKRMQNIPYTLAVGSIMYDVRYADDLKSQTGYVFILNGDVVDWKSTKQIILAISSSEAEYIAASDASKEAVWVRKFISGLGVVSTIEEPIKMYRDNTGAITIANDSGITKGARHYRVKVH